MENNIERRKFFNTAGKGLAALFLFKIIPFKSLFSNKSHDSEIKVKIHPQAVKRNRKGLNR
jgi:hypothetical protein